MSNTTGPIVVELGRDWAFVRRYGIANLSCIPHLRKKSGRSEA